MLSECLLLQQHQTMLLQGGAASVRDMGDMGGVLPHPATPQKPPSVHNRCPLLQNFAEVFLIAER